MTGDFLSQLAEEKTYAVFEIRENNEVSGELVTAWEVDGTQIAVPDGNTKWSVYDHSQISNDASEAEDDTSVVNDGISNAGGYTQAELNDMIAEQEKKIKELDLNKRKAGTGSRKTESAEFRWNDICYGYRHSKKFAG